MFKNFFSSFGQKASKEKEEEEALYKNQEIRKRIKDMGKD